MALPKEKAARSFHYHVAQWRHGYMVPGPPCIKTNARLPEIDCFGDCQLQAHQTWC